MIAVDIPEALRAGNLPIRYDTALSWSNGVRNPARKLNTVKCFDGNLVELIGLVVGDGSWRKIVRSGAYAGGRILYGSKDLELAERAGRLMALVLGRRNPYWPYWSKQTRVFVVGCGSKQFTEMLPTVMQRLKKLIWEFRIRFLKGIYDAEGSITVRVRNNHAYPRVYLTNSDREIIRLVSKMLKSLGMKATLELNTRAGKAKVILGRSTVTHSDVYDICIGRRESFFKFARLIGFRINRKEDLLNHVVRYLRTRLREGANWRPFIPFLAQQLRACP